MYCTLRIASSRITVFEVAWRQLIITQGSQVSFLSKRSRTFLFGHTHRSLPFTIMLCSWRAGSHDDRRWQDPYNAPAPQSAYEAALRAGLDGDDDDASRDERRWHDRGDRRSRQQATHTLYVFQYTRRRRTFMPCSLVRLHSAHFKCSRSS